MQKHKTCAHGTGCDINWFSRWQHGLRLLLVAVDVVNIFFILSFSKPQHFLKQFTEVCPLFSSPLNSSFSLPQFSLFVSFSLFIFSPPWFCLLYMIVFWSLMKSWLFATNWVMLLRSLMMRMTRIPTLTHQAYSVGATRLGWKEWSVTKKRSKTSRKDLMSMYKFWIIE